MLEALRLHAHESFEFVVDTPRILIFELFLSCNNSLDEVVVLIIVDFYIR